MKHAQTSHPSDPAGVEADPAVDSDGEWSSLDVAEAAFQVLTTGPGALCVDGRVVGRGRPVPLGEVRDLVTTPPTDWARTEAVWRWLVERSDSPRWVTGAVGVALPALRKAAARLTAGWRHEAPDVEQCLLTGFLQQLRTVTPDRPRLWSALYWAAVHEAQRWRDRQAAQAGVPLPAAEPAAPPSTEGHPDLVLARAVRRGVLSRADAQLIGRTRLEGVRVETIAAETGRSSRVLRARRAAAEQALAAMIRSGQLDRWSDLGHRHRSDPVLSDEQWARVAPLLSGRHLMSPAAARATIDAIRWHECFGGPWTQLPARFGDPRPICDRYRRWRRSGLWGRMCSALNHPAESEQASRAA